MDSSIITRRSSLPFCWGHLSFGYWSLYLGPLLALLLQSFYHLDPFTGLILRKFTLATYRELLTPANVDIFVRSLTMALAVTLAAIVLAFPLAYTMVS